MNSVVRMIGAGWPDFHARIAAWMSGSSAWTSSPTDGVGWAFAVSDTGVARMRSASGGVGGAACAAQAASTARADSMAARAAAWRAAWITVAWSEQRAVQAALLFAPAHLPRSVGDLEEAGDGRRYGVGLGCLEGVVRAVVIVEEH